jgi:hypothetical protein
MRGWPIEVPLMHKTFRAGRRRLRLNWLFPVLFAAVHPGPAAPAEPVIATLRELPYGTFAAPQPSAVTAEGTVIGADNATGNTLRWRPGEAPEDLGGGPTFSVVNVTPVVNADGSVIVANYMSQEGDAMLSLPRLWEGTFGWSIVPDMQTLSTLAMGISADGQQLAGYGGDPAENFQPWQWSAELGQRMLPVPATMDGGEAWVVANGGHVAAGFVYRLGTDEWGWPLRFRFGARWVDGQLELLEDANGHALGQAVACNADGTVLVGGGIGGDEAPHADSGRAWYWTAAEGAVYLDTSGLPAGAKAPYYAMDVSADGRVIVGTYTIETETPLGIVQTTRPFRWTREGGAKCLIELMAEHGIPFGGDGWSLVPNSMSADGRTILLNGADADYALHSAVLTLTEDGIFGDGFDGGGARR